MKSLGLSLNYCSSFSWTEWHYAVNVQKWLVMYSSSQGILKCYVFYTLTSRFFTPKESRFKQCAVVIVVWIVSLNLIQVIIVRISKKSMDLSKWNELYLRPILILFPWNWFLKYVKSIAFIGVTYFFVSLFF